MNDSNNKQIGCVVTELVIEISKVVKGIEFNEHQITQINSGELNLIIGRVVSQNYSGNGENLSQVTLKTEGIDEYITLSNNSKLLVGKSIIELFQNAYLINQPKEVGILDLDKYKEQFQVAARYGQTICCLYNRCNGSIAHLNVISSEVFSSTVNNNSSLNLLAGGTQHGRPHGYP